MSDEKRGTSSLLAGIIGVVVGAAAVGVAVIMSDEGKKRKIKKAFDNFTKQGGKTAEEYKEKASDAIEEAKKRVEKAKKSLRGK